MPTQSDKLIHCQQIGCPPKQLSISQNNTTSICCLLFVAEFLERCVCKSDNQQRRVHPRHCPSPGDGVTIDAASTPSIHDSSPSINLPCELQHVPVLLDTAAHPTSAALAVCGAILCTPCNANIDTHLFASRGSCMLAFVALA